MRCIRKERSWPYGGISHAAVGMNTATSRGSSPPSAPHPNGANRIDADALLCPTQCRVDQLPKPFDLDSGLPLGATHAQLLAPYDSPRPPSLELREFRRIHMELEMIRRHHCSSRNIRWLFARRRGGRPTISRWDEADYPRSRWQGRMGSVTTHQGYATAFKWASE